MTKLNNSVKNGSPERFGYEWVNYSEISPAYEEQFKRWLPFFSQTYWASKSFLDVGCGMGRNSFWPLSYGAQLGVSIDVDEGTLKSAKKNLSIFHNSNVEFCSAYDIEYKNEFDVVFSIGVIHHLEYPLKALKAMKKAVKPGGEIAIWVYGHENNEWITGILNPLRLALFSRLPIGFVHHLSFYPAILLYLYLKFAKPNLEYYALISTFSFHHLRSIVFDQMLPKIANYWTKQEVYELLNSTELEDIVIEGVNDISWAAKGRKPLSCLD